MPSIAASLTFVLMRKHAAQHCHAPIVRHMAALLFRGDRPVFRLHADRDWLGTEDHVAGRIVVVFDNLGRRQARNAGPTHLTIPK